MAQVLGLCPGNNNIVVSPEEIRQQDNFLQGSRMYPLKEQSGGYFKREEQNLQTLLLH